MAFERLYRFLGGRRPLRNTPLTSRAVQPFVEGLEHRCGLSVLVGAEESLPPDVVPSPENIAILTPTADSAIDNSPWFNHLALVDDPLTSDASDWIPDPSSDAQDVVPVESAIPLEGGMALLDSQAIATSPFPQNGTGGGALEMAVAPMSRTHEPEPTAATTSLPLVSASPLENVKSADTPSTHDTVVTPTVASTPRALPRAFVPDREYGTFRISRSPAINGQLPIRFVLGAYGSAGAAVRDRSATIAAGTSYVDVPVHQLPAVASPEIVTLTLRQDANFQAGKPAATIFLTGDPRTCSETALLQAFREGKSSEAFTALMEMHRGVVLQTCHGILGNIPDAEDVSQIVFLMLAQGQLQIQSTLISWLRTVARNASIGFLRSKNRRARHELRAAKVDFVATEEDTHALREELDAAMTQLPDHLRDAVRLRYLEGWSQREAARILGCPRGTLSQRAARGIQHLRTILGANGQHAG